MSYTSYLYLFVFLGSVFVLYTAVPKKFKWTVLLAASYAFYWINSGKLVVFLLLSTVAVYLAGLFINRIQDGFNLARKSLEKEERKKFKALISWQKKAVVVLTLSVIFGLLLFLKYNSFFGGIFNSAFRFLHIDMHLRPMRFILPLGISYYTLQAASYIIDVYRGKYRATENFGKMALFLSFFPQIVEGPIGRFDLLAEPLYEGHKFDYDNFTQGIQLIAWGMFKKIIIADRANIFVSKCFDNYTEYSGSILLLGGILYTLQIYAEFSGCMDIVTGSAQIFGVPLSKNFERPFFSKSVNEFWRRWHITLGAWLRDYVFYSVSLSKPFMKLSKATKKNLNEFFGEMIPATCALFFTWFGIGFWHGSGWKYIIYGMYYYLIMLLGMYSEPLFVKAYQKINFNRECRIWTVFRILRTTALVVVGMILFRANSVSDWGNILGEIVTNFNIQDALSTAVLSLGMDIYDFLVIGAATLVLFVISLIQEKGIKVRIQLARQNIALRWAVYLGLILAVVIFGAYGAGYDKVDFIYGQF